MARFQEKLQWVNIPVDNLPEDIAVKYVEAHTLLEEVKAALGAALAKPGYSLKVAARDAAGPAIAYAKATGNGKQVMTLDQFKSQYANSGRQA